MRPDFMKWPGHVVGDQGGRNAVLLQFPDGEAGALQERAGLVGEDVDVLARLDGGADDAEGGAVAGGGQRAGIAVGEDGLAVGHQGRAVAADGAVDGDVLLLDEAAPLRPGGARISSMGRPRRDA